MQNPISYTYNRSTKNTEGNPVHLFLNSKYLYECFSSHCNPNTHVNCFTEEQTSWTQVFSQVPACKMKHCHFRTTRESSTSGLFLTLALQCSDMFYTSQYLQLKISHNSFQLYTGTFCCYRIKDVFGTVTKILLNDHMKVTHCMMCTMYTSAHQMHKSA